MEKDAKEHLMFLIRKRGNVRQKLTIFNKYLGNVVQIIGETDISRVDIEVFHELSSRYEKLCALLEEYEELQNDIEVLCNEDEVEAHLENRQSFQDEYFKSVARVKNILEKYNSSLDKTEANSNYNESVRDEFNCKEVPVKLPMINLPTFCGEYTKWLEFKDTFESLINCNSSIGEIQKFHYLRASLQGPAKQVIRSLKFSAVNYKVAWEVLCQRYDNKRALVKDHIQGIYEIEPLKHESSEGLRNLIDEVSNHLLALEGLGEPVQFWDSLLIYQLNLKLDRFTSREWETYKIKNEVPSLEDFKKFIRGRADLLEALEANKTKVGKVKEGSSFYKQKTFLSVNKQEKQVCVMCNKAGHHVSQCKRFLDLPINQRNWQIKKSRVCYCCFDKNHFTRNCLASKCGKCGLSHNVLLHYDNRDQVKGSSVEDGVSVESSADVKESFITLSGTTTLSVKSQVLLSTAVVKIKDVFGTWINCTVLLDSGSTSNFITEKMCYHLGLSTESINVSVVGISQASTKISKKCEVEIKSINSSFKMSMSCLIIPKICDEVPYSSIDLSNLLIPDGIYMANPKFYEPQEVDMLIGASIFWKLICEGQIQLGEYLPTLQNSYLGWIISGNIGHVNVNKSKKVVCNFVQDQDVQDQLAKFWQWEELGVGEPICQMNADEIECENIFVSSLKRSQDGRFVVTIPFKEPVEKLGDSKQMALKRLYALERKLSKNCELKREYCQYMSEYEDSGHMSEIKEVCDPDQACFYLPHHGVIKENSSTTKLRIVYDGSAKSDSGVSVNELQYVGARLQEDLISILLRFRQNSVAIGGDIAKMYRQVWVRQEHRQFQRILWRSNPADEVREYNLNTVTFGLASSPFLAVRCLKQLSLECGEKLSDVSKVIARDFYVDDLISGASSVQEAVNLCHQLSSVLRSAGFELRKFKSNRKEVLDKLHVCVGEEARMLNLGENEKTKTLGLYWNCEADILTYKVGGISEKHVTKRKILSEIAQIFDPLGLLSPCIIIPKILLQKLWLLKLSWDDPIPMEVAKEWYKFKTEMSVLNTISFPRYVSCENSSRVEIHGFSDASQNAIGSCVYLKSIDNMGQIKVRLLCAKGKVAPIKALTIPKLELSGALLLSKLIKEVKNSLTINIDAVFLWCDSQVVLSWIKSPPNQFQVFVSNRVSQIQSMVGCENWFYVKSEDNPADLASRGILPSKLKDNRMWFEGPEWLVNHTTSNLEQVELLEISELPERRKNVCLNVVERVPWCLFSRYSNFTRLIRVFAYCLRFLNNCVRAKERKGGELDVKEMESAEKMLVGISQKDSFSSEMDELNRNKNDKIGKLSNLNPFFDDKGLLRVGGRLKLSEFDYNKKYPILLSAKHPLSLLIVRAEHSRLMHAGPQMVLGSLREKYWIIQGRNLIRKVIHNCVLCVKIKPAHLQIKMGNLPKERVTPQPAFYTTGVDFMGPYNFKIAQGRGYKTYKGYVCLFVCFVTHAIHLEGVTSLSTEAFIATFRRFVARRGKPMTMWSDNGRNFTGAASELKELGQFIYDNNVSISNTILSNEGVKWSFIPAYSPHFGGLWEAGVKSVKFHLRRVVGNVNLTFEDFSTVLCQIEAIVNSRPLTPLSSSPIDLDVLTPAHFLIGRRLTSLPDPSLNHIVENRLSRFQNLQHIQQQFWHQWSKIYVAELQCRTKWKNNHDQLKEGMLVVVKDDNLPALCWRMARVIRIHTGQDGIARVATLKTVNGEIKRSFAKLCPLPVET